jgi:ATP-dependent DNA helicase RecQ
MRKRSTIAKTAAAGGASVGTFASLRDKSLWDALRKMRIELAREQNVLPYVIFHDRTLHALAESRPTTRAAMSEVHGIGQAKLERYADVVLACIREQTGR